MKYLLYTMLLPGLLGLAALASIVLPFARGGDELSVARLLVGCAAMLVIQAAGGYIAGYAIGRRSVRA